MRCNQKVSRLSEGIILEYKNEFENYLMESALGKIYNRDVGKKLIDKITKLSTNEKKVKIQVDYETPSISYGELTNDQQNRLRLTSATPYLHNVIEAESLSRRRSLFRRGEGVSVKILWNPKGKTDFHNQTDQSESESYISLAHELIHCLHYLKGNRGASEIGLNNGNDKKIDEKKVIGLGRFVFKKITENKIRKEHNLPERKSI